MAGKKKTKRFPVKKTTPGGQAAKRGELTTFQNREAVMRKVPAR